MPPPSNSSPSCLVFSNFNSSTPNMATLHQAPPPHRKFGTASRSSSVCSSASTEDSLGGISRINDVRPIYNSSNVSLENKTDATRITPPISPRSLGTERSDSNKSGKPAGEDKVTRKFPEEEEEDILRESDSRFVLFPIKYNEVYMTKFYIW